jgi:hypothetical protein
VLAGKPEATPKRSRGIAWFSLWHWSASSDYRRH